MTARRSMTWDERDAYATRRPHEARRQLVTGDDGWAVEDLRGVGAIPALLGDDGQRDGDRT